MRHRHRRRRESASLVGLDFVTQRLTEDDVDNDAADDNDADTEEDDS